MKTPSPLMPVLAALLLAAAAVPAFAQTTSQPPGSGVKPSDDTRKVEANSDKERPTNPNNSSYQPPVNTGDSKLQPGQKGGTSNAPAPSANPSPSERSGVTPTEPKKVPTETEPATPATKSTDTPTPTLKPSPSATTPETKGSRIDAETYKRTNDGKDINKPAEAIPGDKPQ